MCEFVRSLGNQAVYTNMVQMFFHPVGSRRLWWHPRTSWTQGFLFVCLFYELYYIIYYINKNQCKQ